jgi:hypothetical protein
MLNGWFNGERTDRAPSSGSNASARRRRDRHNEFIEIVSLRPVGRPLQHHGHRLDDELAGCSARMSLPGLRAIPAPYRERGQIAMQLANASSRWSGRI